MIELEKPQRTVLKVMPQKPFSFPANDLYKEYKVLRRRHFLILKIIKSTHEETLNTPTAISLNQRRVYRIPLRTSERSRLYK